MRKVVIALLVAGLVFSVAAPEALGKKKAKRRVRTETLEYQSTSGLDVGPPGGGEVIVARCDPEIAQGCVQFDLKRSDRFVSIEINDATGQPVYANVYDSGDYYIDDACGKSDEPFASPGGFITVWLMTGNCLGTTTPSLPTSGTITATFSNLP